MPRHTAASSPTTNLLDYLHWVSHVHPDTSLHRWRVGKVTATLHVDKILAKCAKSSAAKRKRTETVAPPSIAKRIREIIDASASESWTAELPAVRAEDDAASQVPLWIAALKSLGERVVCDSVDVSTCQHDDRMLTYGRDAPLCSLGDQCLARVYPGNQGPLAIYIPPSVQKLIDDGEAHAPFSKNSTCLLCIRRDVHACVLAWNALVPDATSHIRRKARVPPPFQNLVGVAGGYIESAFVTTPDNGVFGTSSIVGDTGALVVRYNPRTKAFFFDQSKIKWAPTNNHFLSRGTAAASTR